MEEIKGKVEWKELREGGRRFQDYVEPSLFEAAHECVWMYLNSEPDDDSISLREMRRKRWVEGRTSPILTWASSPTSCF